VWLIVFMAPVVNSLLDYLSDDLATMQWKNVFIPWLTILPFFLLFLLNNYVLLPLLALKQKMKTYVAAAFLVAIATFGIVGMYSSNIPRTKPPRVEQRMREQYPERFDNRYFIFSYPPYEDQSAHLAQFRGPFMMRVLIALLMFSFNLAVKLFMKTMRNTVLMQELEHSNLQNELKYLKYQINPHFFMNTLNNIHALIDIDTAEAKRMLMELSRLMRYVLYEANKRTILLSKEVDFLNHYIELMRIRYSDKLHIQTHFPTDAGDVQVPPLLFVTFVENAFKHGVSNQHKSFIECAMKVVGSYITFSCSNSKSYVTEELQHGIGLDNIRKRLDLLFGEDYQLLTQEQSESYHISLTIPTAS
jgi:hypothetical protein